MRPVNRIVMIRRADVRRYILGKLLLATRAGL